MAAQNGVHGVGDDIFDNLRNVFSCVRDFKNAQTEKSMILNSQDAIHKSGVLNLMKLRQINRMSNVECKSRRDKTQEKKTEIDELHLQFQNLQYEVMHLRKETTNCLEFKSNHEDIQLLSLEEFVACCCSKVCKQTMPESDPHKLMLNRLEFELKERKRLASKRKEFESLIKKQQDTRQGMEKKLSSLKPSLESLKTSAVALQEFFSPSIVWEREQYQLALCLPLPLYMLYVQSLGYGAQDEHITFTIIGNKDEIASFNYLFNCEETESENEEEMKKKKKRKAKLAAEDVEPPFCKAFPLSVSLTITSDSGSSVTLLFSHLSFFNVTCASITNITFAESTEKNYFIDKAAFLHCLYEGDSGRTSPNSLVSSQIRKYGGDNFSTAVRKYGFPFKWVQRVCGIQSPSDVIDQSIIVPDREFSALNIKELINVIRRRLHSQECLAQQLNALDQLKLFNSSSTDKQYNTQLIRWGQVSSQDVNKLLCSGLMKFNFQERVNRFFLATFQNGEARLHSVVCVTPNYPLITPVISIMIELSDKHREQYTVQMKDIEAEINIRLVNTLNNEKEILLAQMRRLRHCFEGYINLRKRRWPIAPSTIRGSGRLISFD